MLSVCSYWREVTLNSPRLWSVWYHNSSSWLKAFASRAKAMPLHIGVKHPQKKYLTSLLNVLQSHNMQHQIRELHVLLSHSSLKAVFDALDSKPSTDGSVRQSNIHSLCIGLSGTLGFRLPQPFMDLEFPHLYELDLADCDFDWDARIFNSSVLTHLRIIRGSRLVLPKMPQLLSILERQPRLEKLHLGGTIPVSITDTSFQDRIRLHHLKEIRLTGSRLKDCTCLMRQLSYPRTSSIFLYPKYQHITYYIPDALYFLTCHYGNRNENPTTHQFFVDAAAPPSNVVFSHFDQYCYGMDIRTSGLRLGANARLVMNVCLELPLANLRTLCVQHISLTQWQWRLGVFGVLGRLEELKINGDYVSDAVAALDPERIMEAFREGELKVPLPKLKRLGIKGADFSNPYPGGLRNNLLRCLEARNDAHFPLDELALYYCRGLSLCDIDSFKRWAPVDWRQNEAAGRRYLDLPKIRTTSDVCL
jgi:hypothetical protein